MNLNLEKSFLPSLEEKEALRASIEAEGIRDPILVDDTGAVLDGHHRFSIKPDAPFKVVNGMTQAEKKAFVYRTNMTRRNLSPEQKKEALKNMKKVAKALRGEDHRKNTLERVAALLGVDRSTVGKWFADDMHKGNVPHTHKSRPDAKVIEVRINNRYNNYSRVQGRSEA